MVSCLATCSKIVRKLDQRELPSVCVLNYGGWEVLNYRGWEVLNYRGWEVLNYRGWEVLNYRGWEVLNYRGWEVLNYRGWEVGGWEELQNEVLKVSFYANILWNILV